MNVCPKCDGRKRYEGAGYIFHTCDLCKGVGLIEKKDSEIANDKSNAIDRKECQETQQPITEKRRGWPKGVARGHKKSTSSL